MADLSSLERELATLHASSYGWALACCARNHDEAADVLQQAYFKVLSGRARFDGRAALKTWFFGVVRLTAIEQRRWGFLRRVRAEREARSEPTVPSGPAVDRETAEALSRALAAVSDRQREVLHLTFYEGLTIAEAAGVMGVSLGTARQHYERGKERLRELLIQEGVTFP